MELRLSRTHVLLGTATAAGAALTGARLTADRLRRRRGDRLPRVAEAMTRQPVCVDVHDSAQQAARRMAEEGVGALAVCQENRPVGVVTDRDMVLRVLAQAEDPRRLSVGDCLHGDVTTVTPGDSLGAAAERMRSHGVRRLPVLQDGRLVGLLTQADLAEHDPAAAGSLERSLTRDGTDSRSAAWLFRRAYREWSE